LDKNDSEKNSFIIQLHHSLLLVQYSKQLHVNSQARGLMVCSLSGREREQRLRKKGSFIIQLPHSLFLVQYSKQLHVNSQAGGLMVCSLAGREREQRWRKKFLHHSTSSFLIPCSLFNIQNNFMSIV
jgi:hypothetical protein